MKPPGTTHIPFIHPYAVFTLNRVVQAKNPRLSLHCPDATQWQSWILTHHNTTQHDMTQHNTHPHSFTWAVCVLQCVQSHGIEWTAAIQHKMTPFVCVHVHVCESERGSHTVVQCTCDSDRAQVIVTGHRWQWQGAGMQLRTQTTLHMHNLFTMLELTNCL